MRALHAIAAGLLCASLVVAPGQARPARTRAASDEAVVRDFYRLLVDRRDVAAAFNHVAPDYIEHSADVPGSDRAASMAYMKGLLAGAPVGRVQVVRAASDRGLVFLHARFAPAPGARPVAIVEIFRVAAGRIVEHWDVIAPTPERAINPASPF